MGYLTTSLLFLLAGGTCVWTAHSQTPVVLTVAPRVASAGSPAGVQVSYTVSGTAPQSLLRLRFDTLEPSLQRGTDQVTDLKVQDRAGSLKMNGPTLAKEQDRTWQIWSSERAPQGPVEVHYFVPAALSHPVKRGPHIDLQAAGGGISGAMVSLLLLPQIAGPIDLDLRWVVPPGQHAVSTFAYGNYHGLTTLALLEDTVFLAGPVRAYPDPPPAGGFSMYALGESQTSLVSAFQWSSKAYEAERNALKGSPAAPFRFMIRSYDGGPIDSGHANNGSFLLYLPPSLPADSVDLRELIAHEMVHVFTQELEGDTGDWYTEGIADYLKMKLPEAAHLYSREQYLHLVNDEAAEYYTNPNRLLSNKEASSAKWSRYGAWSLLYTRGTLYLADLDAKLLAHGSDLQVVGLVNRMNALIRGGAARTDQTWVTLLQKDVGPWAVTDWQAMTAGQLILPAQGSFGECLKGLNFRTGSFDLGYLPAQTRAGTVIAEVRVGSKAAQAGLRPGDEILTSINPIPLEESFQSLLHLDLARGKQKLSIAYDPHTESEVQSMKWGYAPKNASCPTFGEARDTRQADRHSSAARSPN